MTQAIQKAIAALDDGIENTRIQIQGGFADPLIADCVRALCENYGYGNVIATASRLWRDKDSVDAYCFGPCVGTAESFQTRAKEALAALRQHQAEGWRSIPDGWALVPRSITLAMQKAYFEVIDRNLRRVESDATFGRFSNQELAYMAMLDAAPQPPHTNNQPE